MTPDHARHISASKIGALSEHAAIVRLLRRGHAVAVPVVDDEGVDLVVDYRITVQVKSATGRLRSCHFGFENGGLRAAVLLCHASDVDVWWVIPKEALLMTPVWARGRCHLNLVLEPVHRTKHQRLAIEWREAWHVFDEL